MTDCSKIPTLTLVEDAKRAMEDIAAFAGSPETTYESELDGSTRDTLTGLTVEAQGVFRLSSDNPQGDYATGVLFNESNWTYFYDGAYWGLSDDFDLSTLPYEATQVDPNNDDNLTVRSNASQSYVQERVKAAEERGLGASLYQGTAILNGEKYVQNGDTVPAETKYLTVLIGGSIELMALRNKNGSQSGPSGVLTTLNTTVRPYSCVIDGVDCWLTYQKYEGSPHGIHIKEFGALLNDNDADDAVYNAAHQYALLLGINQRSGTPDGQGTGIFTPRGVAVFDNPVILLNNSVSNGGATPFFGENKQSTIVKASSSFPVGRGLFERDTVTKLTRFNGWGFANLQFDIQAVNCKAILMEQPTAVRDITTINEESSFYWFMKNIIVKASNSVNSSCFSFAGRFNNGVIDDVQADITPGLTPTIDTIIFDVDTFLPGGSGINERYQDATGIQYSEVSNLTTGTRGGSMTYWKGRANQVEFKNILQGIGNNQGGSDLHFINSANVRVNGSAHEVRGGQQGVIWLDRCANCDISSPQFGTPTGPNTIGFRMTNCYDCTVDGRFSVPSTPSWSSVDATNKLVYMESGCRNCKFKDIWSPANIEEECFISADSVARGNVIDFVRSDTRIEQKFPGVSASVSGSITLPDGVDTAVIFNNVTTGGYFDCYDNTTGKYVANRNGFTEVYATVDVVASGPVEIAISRGGSKQVIKRDTVSGRKTLDISGKFLALEGQEIEILLKQTQGSDSTYSFFSGGNLSIVEC